MQLLRPSSRVPNSRLWTQQSKTFSYGSILYSRSAEEHAFALPLKSAKPHRASSPQASLQSLQPLLTFKSLGLRAPIVAALHSTFTNVKYPTEAQAQFIPAVLEGKDVLLKDITGSGKSFGLILALLSKPRQYFPKSDSDTDPSDKPTITSLVMVPHRDLAYQMLHWITLLMASPSVKDPPLLESVAQVLVRDGVSHLTSSLSSLRGQPPHIIIGTPQALLDVWNEDKDALQIPTLSAVVLDEVDSMVETVTRLGGGVMYHKMKKKLDRHPSAAKQLLNVIYENRIQANRVQFLMDNQMDDIPRQRSSNQPSQPSYSPQLIMSSATLRNHLKLYLYNESGWLQRDQIQKVKGSGSVQQSSLYVHGDKLQEKSTADNKEDAKILGGNELSHYVLVVSENGDIKNIDGAAKPRANMKATSRADDQGIILDQSTTSVVEPEINDKMIEKYENTPSPFNETALEAIATSFAVDVPSVALLVLPSDAPLQRAIFELRMLGVNTHGLDLSVDEQGRSHLLHSSDRKEDNPTLLVSTLATTRGLDLPELTHVFILGIPGNPRANHETVDAYLHIAGRVGRFGRGGKIITVVKETSASDDEVRTHDEVSKVQRLLKRMNIRPSHFPYFE